MSRPPETRMAFRVPVIWLRRVEGLSQREASEKLGMKEGALEGYVSRGVRALAKAVFGTEELVNQRASEGREKESDGECNHG